MVLAKSRFSPRRNDVHQIRPFCCCNLVLNLCRGSKLSKITGLPAPPVRLAYVKPLVFRALFLVAGARGFECVRSKHPALPAGFDVVKSRGFVSTGSMVSKSRFPCIRNPYFLRHQFSSQGPGDPNDTIQITRPCRQDLKA